MQEESEKLGSHTKKKMFHVLDIIVILFFIQFLFLAIAKWLVTFLHTLTSSSGSDYFAFPFSCLFSAAAFEWCELEKTKTSTTMEERERKELLISTKMNICMDMKLWLNFILFFVLLMEMGGGKNSFLLSSASRRMSINFFLSLVLLQKGIFFSTLWHGGKCLWILWTLFDDSGIILEITFYTFKT